MKADEAAELMDKDKESDTFKQRAAVVIAFFAMCLAITGLGGSNAAKEAFNNNILAANYFNFYQAKNIRQTAYQLAADEFELAWLNDPALSPDMKKAMQEKARRLQENRRTLRNPSRKPTKARKSCWRAPASTSMSATSHSRRIRISTTPRHSCKSRSC